MRLRDNIKILVHKIHICLETKIFYDSKVDPNFWTDVLGVIFPAINLPSATRWIT